MVRTSALNGLKVNLLTNYLLRKYMQYTQYKNILRYVYIMRSLELTHLKTTFLFYTSPLPLRREKKNGVLTGNGLNELNNTR